VLGLDTNILVRYFTKDGEDDQVDRAANVMDSLSQADPGYVNLVVLVELWWTLRRSYGYSKSQCCDLIEMLLEVDAIVVQAPDVVRSVVAKVASGADFADALIAEINADAGCRATVTLDAGAAKHLGVVLV